MNEIKYMGFCDELEKLGFIAGLGPLLGRVIAKTGIGAKAIAGAGKFISRYGTKQFSKPMFQTAGKTYARGISAAGSKTVRPWLGTKKTIEGVRKVPIKTPFLKNPLKATGEVVLAAGANTLDRVRYALKEGIGKYSKEEIRKAQYFSKTVTGKGGSRYEVYGKRSIPGRIANTAFDTGLGFGALGLATNKYDDKGKQQSMTKRIGGAAKDTLSWGLLRPLTMAKFTAVDLPRETKNIIKGF